MPQSVRFGIASPAVGGRRSRSAHYPEQGAYCTAGEFLASFFRSACLGVPDREGLRRVTPRPSDIDAAAASAAAKNTANPGICSEKSTSA